MQPKKICYLTDGITTLKLSAGDDLLIQELERRNILIDFVDWKNDVADWTRYDLVMIRTTWDYMHQANKYKARLEEIASKTKLINPLDTILWNMNKTYLLDLQKLGFPIIPTRLFETPRLEEITAAFESLNQGEGIIIKPTIGASSQGIQWLHSAQDYKQVSNGQWFMQPFQKSIQQKGEYSLFYFNGIYSHAINKLPKKGEFRSQEEFESHVTCITPSNEMQKLGEDLIRKIPYPTDYARMDIILDNHDSPQIVELELIEPCLFIKYAPIGAQNFASHLQKLLED